MRTLGCSIFLSWWVAVLVAADPAPLPSIGGTPLPSGPPVVREALPGSGGLAWARVDDENANISLMKNHNTLVVRQAAKAGGAARLAVTTWQGSGSDGQKRYNSVALFGPAGKTAWIRLADFSIRNGAGRDGQCSWGPQRAKDLFLRFGFLTTPLAEAATAHGKALEFGTAVPHPAVVVSLAARHGVGGFDNWTVGYGFGCAVVQIPAGKTISEARKDPANVLLELPLLKSYPMDVGFRFQLLDQGHWWLALDTDRDGEADLDLTDASPGAKPWTVPGFTHQHGLVLNLNAAGGASAESVNLTQATLEVKLVEEEPPRQARERWPLVLDRGALLPADPFPVHGQRFAAGLAVELEPGTARIPVASLGSRRFGTVVSAAAPGEVAPSYTLIQAGRPATRVALAPRLEPIDPATGAVWHRSFVPGQRVLIAGRESVELRRGSAVSAVGKALPGGFLLTMPGPDQYDLAVDGKVRRSVRVGQTDLPAIVAVQAGKPRVVEVWCPGQPVESVRIDGGVATVELLDRAPPFMRLLVQAASTGASKMVLIGAGSVELGRAEVRAFNLAFGGGDGGGAVINHRSGQETPQGFRITMDPWTPGVPLIFRTINAISAFEEYAITMTVDSDGGPTSNHQPGFRIVDGTTPGSRIGVFDYAIMLTSQDGSWAHNYGVTFPEEIPEKPSTKPAAKPAAKPATAKPAPVEAPPPPPPPPQPVPPPSGSKVSDF